MAILMRFIFSSLLYLIVVIQPAIANEKNYTLGFFGNLGVVTSSSEKLGYRGEIDSFDAVFDGDFDFSKQSKFGAQLEYHLSDDLDFFVQGLYRGDNNDTFDEILNIAFLRYKINNQFSIRIGRTPFDLFLLTEYRDVDFAYSWAKLPQEVYGMLPPRHIDGADFIYRDILPIGDFRAKLTFGKVEYPLNDSSVIEMRRFINASAELSDFNWSVGIRYSNTNLEGLEDPLEALRQGINSLNGIWTMANSFSGSLSTNEIGAEYLSIGGRYDWGAITVYGELARIFGENSPIFRGINNGYISILYQQSAFQHFVGFAFANSPTFEANIQENLTAPTEALPPEVVSLLPRVESSLNNGLNSFAPNQQTWSIGTRYNFNEHIAFKLQLDASRVEPMGDTLWLRSGPQGISESEWVQTVFLNMSFAY